MEVPVSDSSEFPVLNFCPVPKNNNLEFYFLQMEPCLEVKILSYHLLHYTENGNSEFSKPTKAFNLENIVQTWPVFFQIRRVNKDFF